MKKLIIFLILLFGFNVLADEVGTFIFRANLDLCKPSPYTAYYFTISNSIVADMITIKPFSFTRSGSFDSSFFNYPLSYYGLYNLDTNQFIATTTRIASETLSFIGNYYSCTSCGGVCGYYNNFSFSDFSLIVIKANKVYIPAGSRLVLRFVNTNNQIFDVFEVSNDILKISGQVNTDFKIIYPSGDLDINSYNNIIKFILNGLAGYNQLYKYDLTLTNSAGTLLYSSTTQITTTTINENTTTTLNVSSHDLKQIILDNLNLKGYSAYVLYLRLYLTNNTLTIQPLGITTFSLTNTFLPLGDFLNFYYDNISAFGLSGATPTSLFINVAKNIDTIFNQSLFEPFKPNLDGKNLADRFNDFLAYIKALANFLPFQLILAFFTFWLLVSIIKRILLK